jgi:hypothetical protein
MASSARPEFALGAMTQSDDLRVARDRLRGTLQIYADAATADSVARAIELLIDAKLRALVNPRYINPMTGISADGK